MKVDKRIFLFLQGHPSSFPRLLADELESRGHCALRINLCVGDELCWLGRDAVNYRGFASNWRGFLSDFIDHERVSDILYYGDRKPYHIVAGDLARERNINAFVYEFGYLRPDWLTIERYGMSAYSHFPKDPDLIGRIAANFKKPDMQRRYAHSKNREIFHEVSYNLMTFFTPFLYPFYNADRYYNLLLDYISGIPGLFLESRNDRHAQELINRLVRTKKQPFFLFPLQLQNDYQLRANAPFNHQSEAIELAIQSFTQNASPEAQLIFKQHPLDNGWEGWSGIVEKISRKYDVSERVHVIIGGDLDLLLKKTIGCVMINSTVGMHAIFAGSPVKVLGTALYDIAGLCHQGTLDEFWETHSKPDPELAEAFQRALAGTIQVKGNFFTKEGQAVAIPRMADMLIDGSINGAGAFIDPPPRLVAS